MPATVYEAADDDAPEPQQTAQATPAPPAEPTPAPTSQTPIADAVQSASASPAPAAATPAPAEFQSLQDWYKEQGLDLGQQFQSDEEMARALADAYKSRNQPDPYVQQFQQYQPQFFQWLSEQQKQAAQPAETPTGPWAPPATRDEVQRYLSTYYKQDPQTGQLQAQPNTPLEVRNKVEGYSTYISDWQHRLQHDPQNALGPLVQEMVKPLLAQAQEQARDEMAAQEMVRRNEAWLYQSDPTSGKITLDARGQRVLSPEGQRFAQLVGEANNYGIRGTANQEHYALKMLWAEMKERSEAGTPQKQDDRNKAFQQRQNRRPSVGTQVQQQVAPPQIDAMGLRDALKKAFSEEGIDDAALAEDFAK